MAVIAPRLRLATIQPTPNKAGTALIEYIAQQQVALHRARTAAELHRARKAAKRARYAAELAAPLLGHKSSKRLVQRNKELQDLLGEHQDSVVAAELLRQFGASAGMTPGQNGFTYGLLYARELASAARIRAILEKGQVR